MGGCWSLALGEDRHNLRAGLGSSRRAAGWEHLSVINPGAQPSPEWFQAQQAPALETRLAPQPWACAELARWWRRTTDAKLAAVLAPLASGDGLPFWAPRWCSNSRRPPIQAPG